IRVFAGPEPKGEGNELPLEILVAELEGDATELRLERLAARTDVFVRIEATTASGALWGIAHAKTTGGPRAALDSALRSVHAVAPHVLQLVLETRNTNYSGSTLSGVRGQHWQGGQWKVTRSDGTPIGIQ